MYVIVAHGEKKRRADGTQHPKIAKRTRSRWFSSTLNLPTTIADMPLEFRDSK